MRTWMLLPLAGCLALTACGKGDDTESTIADTARGATAVAVATSPAADPAASAILRATAAMKDTAGREIGTLTLTESTTGITVTGMLSGLSAGAHGIHIHQAGRCEPPFESAGGHWNPTARKHGLQNPEGPHMGDMPSMQVGAKGSVDLQLSTPGGGLRGQHPLMDDDGASIVVHAAADDGRTDPSGNSGARIACGVVTMAASGG